MWFGKVWGVSLHGDVLLLVGGVVASYRGDRFERLGRNKLVKSFSQCPLESFPRQTPSEFLGVKMHGTQSRHVDYK